MAPSISIIVPVYNTEAYLPECLDSILAQTHTDLELILVDDGSTDGSPAICDAYAAKDPRVRVIHRPRSGSAASVRAGVQAAAGQYIGFVDSDDWIDPDYYDYMYRAITQSGADVVMAERVDETDPPVYMTRSQPVVYSGRDGIRALMDYYFLHSGDSRKTRLSYSRCDKLYKARLWQESLPLLDERVILNEDRMANAAVLPLCEKVILLSDTPKYHYRKTPHSVSNERRYEDTRFNTISQYYDALTAIAKARELDMHSVLMFVGSSAFYRLGLLARWPDASRRERSAYLRDFLAAIPPAALREYVLAKHSYLRPFCFLQKHGLYRLCAWTVMLRSAVTAK